MSSNTWNDIAQVGIALLGVSSIFLVAKKNKRGFVIGLLSEPFWFITTIIDKQWGIVFLNFIYVGTWLLGIYEWFYKSPRQASAEGKVKNV